MSFFVVIAFSRLHFVVEVIGVHKTKEEPKTELVATHTDDAANRRKSPLVVHAEPKLRSGNILKRDIQALYMDDAVIDLAHSNFFFSIILIKTISSLVVFAP